MIKKKEIVEHVASTTDLKKREVREALEGVLSFLHERLLDGEEVQVPPLGKVRVVVQNDGTTRQKTVYRLILQKPKPEPDTASNDVPDAASEDAVAS